VVFKIFLINLIFLSYFLNAKGNQTLKYRGKDFVKVINSKVNKFDSDLVYIEGKQGGFFKFIKKYKNINNGCTIFNGWVRQTQDTKINILWCGADGNGINDDTEAFNLALNTAYKYRRQNRVLFLPAGTYRIKKSIKIPSKVDGKKNNFFTILGEGSLNAGVTQIYFEHPLKGTFNDKMNYWIDSQIEALTIKNIRFKQLFPKGKNIYSYSPYTLLRAKPYSENYGYNGYADTDTAIKNCTFCCFHTVVENWGRGLKFSNNTASLCYTPIVLEWGNNYLEYPKNIGKNSTGFRAFNIVGNRFHSNGSFAINNIGKNASKIHSILISDNLLDIGRGIFKGVLIDGSINNTLSIMTPSEVLVLLNKSKNYQINNLVASGNKDAKRVTNHYIVLNGIQENAQFNNINLNLSRKDAILILGTLNSVIFNNINMKNIGYKNNYALFKFLKKGQKVVINGLYYSFNSIKLVNPIQIKDTKNKNKIRLINFLYF